MSRKRQQQRAAHRAKAKATEQATAKATEQATEPEARNAVTVLDDYDFSREPAGSWNDLVATT
jgi:hypothetical protein